ncbi:flagellar hook-associated protein FlgL [Rhodocyclus gracilis]|uniref:Flagellar hook-associated protein 3 n=1 Tax=Rhodocyclus tenuis TaxID=1066 RepID=A0A6L5JWI3_RHOTE|nr:flagellar hook-associated protein FlgL [Rhodocyclus gracilis]MQY51599.1 flagellar hook-associated protein 3 [Rhodocyclus gracilis]
MRISSSQIFDAGVAGMQRIQSALYNTQNQLDANRRVLTPSDDPVASAQELITTQSQSVNQQYLENQGDAGNRLALEEDRLSSLVDLVQYIRERAVDAGNASYSDKQRASIATDLQQQLEQLKGLANSADAQGLYLFSGYQGSTQPFVTTASGTVQYVGDDGQRQLQVGASRDISISDSGLDVFARIRNGNGTFVTGGGASNTGTGVIDAGSVLNPAAWTGHSYSLSVTSVNSAVSPPVSTYSLTDTDPATGASTVTAGLNFTAGAAITQIPGINFSIKGTPTVGDTFSVTPSTSQSLFATVQSLINTVNTPIAGNTAAGAQLQIGLSGSLVNLDQALSNLGRVQATVGSRRSELQSLTDLGTDVNLNYTKRLNDLVGLDQVSAISLFTQQQIQLQAAQKSYVQISGLSLFNYL